MRLLLVALALMLVTTASGTVVTIVNSVGGELNLGVMLNAATGNLGIFSDTGANVDKQLPDKVFEQCSPGSVTITILGQQAGHASYHRVGYYQPAGTTPINGANLNPPPNGVTFLAGNLGIAGGGTFATSGFDTITGRFGLFFDDRFYDGSRPQGYYPSEEQLDPSGNDIHFAVFYDYVTGTSNINPCSYLIAVEDLHGGGDKDYNDMVFRITNVRLVPEPTSVVLLGLAIFPVLLRRRRLA